MLKVRRKRWPYSKVILGLLLAVTIMGNAASYVLAWHGYDTAEGVTTTMTSVFGAAIVGYLIKSLGEHHSMNKYGVSEEE